MLQPTSATTGTPAANNLITAAALAVAGAGALAIGGALFFEHVVGLSPCPLCYQQRWPYYAAIPLAIAIAVGARGNAPRWWLRAGLVLIALTMMVGAGLGLYHAGVEWKWWAGPSDCAGTSYIPGSAGGLRERMERARVVRCDEAAWRDPVIYLSLAGWNVLMSLALAIVALLGFKRSKASAP